MAANKKAPTKKAVANKKPVSKSKKKDDDDKKAVKYVRGGAICDPKEKGAKLIRGSGSPAVCRPTPGPDPRPRYRAAGR